MDEVLSQTQEAELRAILRGVKQAATDDAVDRAERRRRWKTVGAIAVLVLVLGVGVSRAPPPPLLPPEGPGQDDAMALDAMLGNMDATMTDGGTTDPVAFKMTDKPGANQKRPPCEAHQVEINGGCWLRLAVYVKGCPESFEATDPVMKTAQCYLPVRKTQRPPTSAGE